jgi:prepilin-type N-terminal cleavage/methylation domain-containing protein
MRLRSRRSGFTLVEVLVGVTLLTVALIGLAGMASTNLVMSRRAREEVQYWADAQHIVDSLMSRGFGNVTGGSVTVRGRAISWTVGSAATAPQSLKVLVQRPGYQKTNVMVNDTISMYLAKMVPGP